MTVRGNTIRVHVRWLIRRDFPEVQAIENASSEFPWSEQDLLDVLNQRNAIGMVAELGEKVVGFMIYELHKKRLHLLKFAVHPEFRRQSVGTQLIGKLVGKLSSQRRSRITLRAHENNLDAQLFYRRLDFRATKVSRSYFEDGAAAYIMQYRLVDNSDEDTAVVHNGERDANP